MLWCRITWPKVAAFSSSLAKVEKVGLVPRNVPDIESSVESSEHLMNNSSFTGLVSDFVLIPVLFRRNPEPQDPFIREEHLRDA